MALWKYKFIILYAISLVVIVWAAWVANFVAFIAGIGLWLGTILVEFKMTRAETVGEDNTQEVTEPNASQDL